MWRWLIAGSVIALVAAVAVLSLRQTTSRPAQQAAPAQPTATAVPKAAAQSEVPVEERGAKSEPAPSATGSIAGRVVDAEEERPIGSVEISAYHLKHWHWRISPEPRELKLVISALTDADGRFKLEGLTEGRFLVVREPVPPYKPELVEDHTVVSLVAGEELDGLTYKLETGVSAAGTVVDTDGRAVPDALVQLIQRNGIPRQARTDAHGHFEFYGVEVGSPVAVEATARRMGPARVRHRQLMPKEGIKDFRLVLPGGGASLDGVLVDEAGKPIAGANMFCNGATTMATFEKTDANGNFELIGLSAAPEVEIQAGMEDGRIEIQDDGGRVALQPGVHLSGLRLIAKVVNGDRYGDQDFMKEMRDRNARPKAAFTTGRVVDANGKPVDGISVALDKPMSDVMIMPDYSQTNSGPDGLFAIDIGDSENATIVTSGEGFRYQRFPDIRSRSKDNELVVLPPLELKGAVVDGASGEPLKRFRVSVSDLDAEIPDARGISGSGTTIFHPAGQFALPYPMENTVRVHINAPGYGPASADTSAGGALVTIPLQHQLTLAGIALFEDGTPIADSMVVAQLGATDYQMGQRAELAAKTMTDQQGRFSLTGLSQREYGLVVRSSGGIIGEPVPVDLARQPVGEVKLTLPVPGIVEGTVTFEGQPLPDDVVEIEWVDASEADASRGASRARSASTGEGGFFHVELLPGRYMLRCPFISVEDYRGEPAEQQVDVAAGQVTVVNF